MRRYPILLLLILAVGLSAAPLRAAAEASLLSLDADRMSPVELGRAARTRPPGSLLRVAGLRDGEGRPLALALEAATLFAPGFKLYVDGREAPSDAPRRLVYFRGTAEHWPGSSVAIVVDSATGAWSGSMVTDEAVYVISLAAASPKASAAEGVAFRRADPVDLQAFGPGSINDGLVGGVEGLDKTLASAGKRTIAAPGAEYDASIAIESDFELFERFGSVELATSYIVSVVGGVSELYFRQLGVSLSIGSLFLYTAPDDPWNAPNPHSGDTADVLCEFARYWQKFRPLNSFPRNAAVFFTGKWSRDIGGQAWVGGLCRYSSPAGPCPSGGYGIVVVTRRDERDLYVTAHELGHTFGSEHTHCYNPPIDECHSGEVGCHPGPESSPEEGGSVMSYCSVTSMSMGEPGRYGVDSQRVVEVIRGVVDTVGPGCLARTNDPYALAAEAGERRAILTWTDPFGSETNWLVEQKVKGKFKQVKSLAANTTRVRLTKVKPGDSFRVRAKLKKDFSDYSAEVVIP